MRSLVRNDRNIEMTGTVDYCRNVAGRFHATVVGSTAERHARRRPIVADFRTVFGPGLRRDGYRVRPDRNRPRACPRETRRDRDPFYGSVSIRTSRRKGIPVGTVTAEPSLRPTSGRDRRRGCRRRWKTNTVRDGVGGARPGRSSAVPPATRAAPR